MQTVGSIKLMFQFDKMMTTRFNCCNLIESNLTFFCIVTLAAENESQFSKN